MNADTVACTQPRDVERLLSLYRVEVLNSMPIPWHSESVVSELKNNCSYLLKVSHTVEEKTRLITIGHKIPSSALEALVAAILQEVSTCCLGLQGDFKRTRLRRNS
jgi:hypothetical protein